MVQQATLVLGRFLLLAVQVLPHFTEEEGEQYEHERNMTKTQTKRPGDKELREEEEEEEEEEEGLDYKQFEKLIKKKNKETKVGPVSGTMPLYVKFSSISHAQTQQINNHQRNGPILLPPMGSRLQPGEHKTANQRKQQRDVWWTREGLSCSLRPASSPASS